MLRVNYVVFWGCVQQKFRMLVALPETREQQLIRTLEPGHLGTYLHGVELLKVKDGLRSLRSHLWSQQQKP